MAKRIKLLGTLLLLLTTGLLLRPSGAVSATAAPTPACAPTVLVLSAMPLELSPLTRQAKLDESKTVTVNGRHFYVGTLAGKHVVLAMTGIGPVNARETATAAFEHVMTGTSRCRFAGTVFSGVAGSQQNIADVTVPRRWSIDNGKTWTAVDPALLRAATKLQGTTVPLSRDVPVGDPACLCGGSAATDAPVGGRVPQAPKVVVGGDGLTSDPFNGKAIPCVPGGGDIAGCAPCLLPNGTVQDAANFANKAPTVLDPALVGLLQPPEATTATDAQDEETAAVALVARTYRVPFLGIRAVSDGQHDPLHLPGFPAQFFVYRQLAANNAAAVTVALLRALTLPTRP